MKKIFLLFLALTLAVSLSACGNKNGNEQDDGLVATQELRVGQYVVDGSASSLRWEGAKVVGADHTGTLNIKGGTLNISDDQSLSGYFMVDMTSLESDEDIAGLEDHLRGEDFFAVGQYPEATFDITSVILLSQGEMGESKYIINGNLRIKDKTNFVAFEADLAMNNNELMATADFSIDRTQWGIEAMSGNIFKELGDKAVNDNIYLSIQLVARAK